MAVQDDINIFINKAQTRIVLLGDEMVVRQQNGLSIERQVWIINKLNAAIIGLENPNSFTTAEIYSIIGYYNELGDLTPLNIAYFNATAPNVIFIGGGGSGITTLAGLTDTDIINPINNQFLVYNGNKWANRLLLGSDVTTALGYTPLSNSLASANILVGNASNVATPVSLNQDGSLNNAGALTVIGLRGSALPSLTNGLLRYNGSWVMDNSTYLTTISGISAGGDLSGTYANPTVSKILGNSIPSNSAGALLNNGSGTLSWTPVYSQTQSDARYLQLSGGTLTGNLFLNGDASAPLQPVSFQQFSNALQGLQPKPTARARTTAALPTNIYNNGVSGVGATLTGSSNGVLPAQDGVTLSVGDVLLVFNESTSANNGLYTVTSLGSVSTVYVLTRSVDMDASSEFNGSFIVVDNEGTTYKNTLWMFNYVSGFTTGTSSVTFTNLNPSTSYIAGAGLTLSGTTFSISTGGVTNAMLAGSITASKLVGTDIATVGTITTGTWQATPIADAYIASASVWNAKVSSQWTTQSPGIYYANTVLIGSSTNPTTVNILNTIETSTNAQRGVSFYQYNNGVNSSTINFLKSRGTVGTPATIATSDVLSDLKTWAFDGTQFTNAGSAKWTSTGTIASAQVPTIFTLSTMSATGTLTVGLTIDQAQNTTLAANVTYVGILNKGTLGYTDTGELATFQSSLNGYNQIVVQNTNSGTAASSDYIVSNNSGTATTFYGDFGMNSSGFAGSGSLNLANAVYLYSNSGDLVLGTSTANAVHFVVNNGTTDAMSISSAGNLTVTNQATFNAGLLSDTIGSRTTTLTLTPVTVASGTNAVGNPTVIQGGLGYGGAVNTTMSSLVSIQNPLPVGTGTTAQTTYNDNAVFGIMTVTTGSRFLYGMWIGVPQASCNFNNNNYLIKYDNGGATMINAQSASSLALAYNGTAQITLGSTGISVATTMTFSGSGSISSSNSIACNSYVGQSAGSTVTINPQNASGTNAAGGTLNLRAGAPTGNATITSVNILGPTIGTSGSTVQTVSTIASFNTTSVTISNTADATQAGAGSVILSGGIQIAKRTWAANDVIVNASANGLIQKSPNAHFWRQTIDNTGAITWTDLGTSI